MTESLADFLRRVRVQVDDALDRWLPRPPVCPDIVSEAMRYSVFAGGKRLRPVLALAAAEAAASRHTAGGAGAVEARDAFRLALPSACAIELIHTYSLIHDDLPAMDNDSLRRGRPTLHTIYGDGIAILAGDGLHAEAFTLLAREPASSDDAALAARKLRVARVIGEAAGPLGMVGGQAIDLQAADQVPGHRLTLDYDGLRAMHARKTGALIRAAAVSGAIMTGASDSLVAAVERYAADLGLAFQIIDDVLDVEGTPEQLGKTTGKDAAADKPTYPSLYGLEASRALAGECVSRARRTLADAGLIDSQLTGILDWVVSRKN